ncbi:MAG: aminotransferase class I/II-fold pyridoxal phosphate-dependent enzyme [Cyanobacteria bacterium J06638_6]
MSQRLDQDLSQAPTPALSLRRLPSESPIICLQHDSAATVLKASEQLRQMGLWVAPVRPPTVPTSRLRITLMATHQSEHIDRLLQGLSRLTHLNQ